MYAKCGSSVSDTQKAFDEMHLKDMVTWTTSITGSLLDMYARYGDMKEANLVSDGLSCKNEVSCSALIAGHNGLLNEGQFYFELMKRYNVEPKVEHYVTIVDLLGRVGLLDQAQRYINDMPIEPTVAIWGALLGACRMHRNMELGAYAAKHVFELDPHDSGPHVLLSTIYASARRWSDATRVRKMMKDSGVKKEHACNWEREAKLQYHSEKLALAFALLNTPPGATIQIKKNIRMCGDCHSAIKFVSTVMEREILVRDTNGFHHFSNGFCSCGDY
ncbi:hypothetical protein AAC387_Pa02g0295 [Persea americana]